MFGILSAFVETALMVLDPAYKTYKELKTFYRQDAIPDDDGKSPPSRGKDTDVGEGLDDGDRSEQRRWLLTHWIVYAAYKAVDFVARPWLPMYGIINIAVVVWLRSGGSTIVYRSFIEPFLNEHEPTVDAWLERFDEAKDKMSDATAVLSTAASAAAAAVTNTNTETVDPAAVVTNTNTKTNTNIQGKT